LANFAAGSLLFGQFLSERPYSPAVALIGLATWIVLFGAAFFFAAGEELMTFSLILLGGITSVVLVIALVDWLGRRRDRQSRHRAA
jgi:predicted RND superfamily exporter protein